MADEMDGHELDKMRGLTFLWVLVLGVGMALMFGLTQWGLLDDVPLSESAAVAVGTNNGIGIIAFGGWNAIGIVAVGGANSIGIISIGGLNSVGVISFGGLNSVGFAAHGGLNAFGARGTRFFAWSPLKTRVGRPI